MPSTTFQLSEYQEPRHGRRPSAAATVPNTARSTGTTPAKRPAFRHAAPRVHRAWNTKKSKVSHFPWPPGMPASHPRPKAASAWDVSVCRVISRQSGQFRHSKEKTKTTISTQFFFFSSLHDLLSAVLPTLLHLPSPRFMRVIIIQYHLIIRRKSAERVLLRSVARFVTCSFMR